MTTLHPARSTRRAFSLIEMIGVLAIISIVAAILTPNLARRISRLNGEKEDEALGVLAEGLTATSGPTNRSRAPARG